MNADTRLVILSDQPVDSEGQRDLLDRRLVAERLCGLIRASRHSAPFTLAVYGEWGAGKSSMLRQMADQLTNDPDIEIVWFNAWTARSADALELLIKSVLDRLDPRMVRRLVRRMSRGTGPSGWARLLVRVVAGFLRLDRVVDDVWNQLALDARTRNQARELLKATLQDWTSAANGPGPKRMITVFVDDLDRCPPETIRIVCDAIKQYLNINSLVFVLGCDRNIIEHAISEPAQTAEHDTSRRYLDKVIQAAYSIPAPTDEQVSTLITGYALESGTDALLKGAVAEAVALHAGRNPRLIKRLINNFVIEYGLDHDWQKLGAAALIRIVLLQEFYPRFLTLLSRIDDSDPIDEIIDYIALRQAILARPDELDKEDYRRAERILRSHRVTPDSVDTAPPVILESVERVLPEEFLVLAQDRTLGRLVAGLEDSNVGGGLRDKLRRRQADSTPTKVEPATESSRPVSPDVTVVPNKDLVGFTVVWLTTRPANDRALLANLAGRGTHFVEAMTVDEVLHYLRTVSPPPDAIVSNLHRDNDKDGGFADIEEIRDAGYDGPVMFYTGYVSRVRRERASQLGAAITASAVETAIWLTRQARSRLPRTRRAAPN